MAPTSPVSRSRAGTPVRRLSYGALAVLLLVGGPPILPQPALAAPEAHFSPGGGIRDRLLRQINHTKTSIDLAIFDFTSGELAGALRNARERGVVVRIVADSRQARTRHSEIPALMAAGVQVRLSPPNGRGIMHHKFAVFDRDLLVTGSYNWTDAAERANFENAIFLDDPGLVGEYAGLFDRLFARAAEPARPAARRP